MTDQTSCSRPDRPDPARLGKLCPEPRLPVRRGSRLARVVLTVGRRHWAVTGTLALYALAALIVPTGASTLVSDDWIFVRSVETVVREGKLEILPISAPTAVFHVAWGALFATVFGFSFGAIRLSTVVLVGLSACAFYGLCRELGISLARSALGTAVYLFNPLLFVLGFSFMTDAPSRPCWSLRPPVTRVASGRTPIGRGGLSSDRSWQRWPSWSVHTAP